MQAEAGQHAHFDSESGPHRPRRDRTLMLVAMGAVAVLLVLSGVAYALAGITVAGDDHRTAEQALQQARSDSSQISSAMKGPYPGYETSKADLSSTLPSEKVALVEMKASLDGKATGYEQARAVANADRARLVQISKAMERDAGRLDLSERPSLQQVRQIVLLPRHPELEQDRGRIDSVVAGYAAAARYFQIGEEQARTISVLYDSISTFVDVVAALNERQDVGRALGYFPAIDSKDQQALALSKGVHVPSQIRVSIEAWATVMADYKQVLQALQARDPAAATAALHKYDADRSAYHFDQKGFDAAQDSLFTAQRTEYKAALTRAGFKVAV